MFRTCVSSGSRTLTTPSFTSTSRLHTSAVLNAAGKAKKTGLRTKKLNIAHTKERLEAAEANRPSIILGIRPGEEYKWEQCDLAKIIVTEEALATAAQPIRANLPIGAVNLPREFAYGVDKEEQKVLFDLLPTTTTYMDNQEVQPLAEKRELLKANMVAKALDLRNANAAGIAFENRRRIIKAFSTPANPFDPGRTEVQVALLTYKIRNLWTHLTTFKRDVGNRRALRKFVHQRAKLLRYLKGVSLDRYDTILEQLALEPESVEGELTV
ncbi:S15/NS1 RNA-binding domain-containing protein [Pholiota conissans]|uniref:S15/NS1 RNA-binding domain-containing protein n=1 Tax=Pholiota conissans TaxID=109636 RepID=A0A9P5Z5B0_9AGAR|nr:S15/NS1 RNA-binding domain-containing protein [Pholiota conissans]